MSDETEYGSFTEAADGCVCKLFIGDGKWIVTVTAPDGRSKLAEFPWTYEPRFGMDVADAKESEEVVDRLLKEIRAEKP